MSAISFFVFFGYVETNAENFFGSIDILACVGSGNIARCNVGKFFKFAILC